MSTVAASAAVMVPAPRPSSEIPGGPVVNESVPVALVVGEGQEVRYTRSRRAGPRAWLRAVVWLVESDLHPKAGPWILPVARDLAARMDYGLGLVMYDLEGTARRTGTSVATVKRHVQILRELGALAWRRHGSKANLSLPGRAYTATATIYAAVIPPVYDEAMGHRLAGSGYEARVCGMTVAGRERAAAESAARSEARRSRQTRTGCRSAARRGAGVRGAAPVDNSAVDNRSSKAREPHSLGRYHRSPEVQVESGCKYTSRQRASRSTTSPAPRKVSFNSDGSRRTASQTRASVAITSRVRALVNWAQGEDVRRLDVVLRPRTDAGWDEHMIAAELHSWMLTWRPSRPAAYIRARLAKQDTAEHAAAAYEVAEGWDEQEASGTLTASKPGLVRSVLDGLAAGMAAYSARQAERGLDDLTDTSAAADMAAFLGTTTGALA
ncbi:cell wall protein [Streptomyces sp. NBC_00264]|uniref:cell wall protein n=1 Tax=unclassified Streptomyces TaxID=2593676 RepID=UPI00224E40DF|nr:MULTISPECIES: cell wall protein [unclassified Streptomyces]MCX5166213.1 cell wall protein [Streptomyces sp. NBC_00305]MCX5224730.1 cell wall protein [Streptomyces sp. NBC_00264]